MSEVKKSVYGKYEDILAEIGGYKTDRNRFTVILREKNERIAHLKHLLECFIELHENHSHLALHLPDRVEFKKEILRGAREAVGER